MDGAGMTKDQIIEAQQARIKVLEFHLGKLRDLCFLGFSNTVHVLPTAPKPAKQKSQKKEKS